MVVLAKTFWTTVPTLPYSPHHVVAKVRTQSSGQSKENQKYGRIVDIGTSSITITVGTNLISNRNSYLQRTCRANFPKLTECRRRPTPTRSALRLDKPLRFHKPEGDVQQAAKYG
nr:hypothetical protein CFP56_03359 [Quercus suber]